jgi:hypothetical protein
LVRRPARLRNTPWFYKEIAAPFFEKELPELPLLHFRPARLRRRRHQCRPQRRRTAARLVQNPLAATPAQKTFANDSNALNKQFYDELLYILGLEEVKEGGKKIIDRADKRRCDGSLLENTLSELEVSGVWRDATDLDQFGDTPEKQRFSIALELCITWLNRILFLKLLEGQLLRWRPKAAMRLLSVEQCEGLRRTQRTVFPCPGRARSRTPRIGAAKIRQRSLPEQFAVRANRTGTPHFARISF